MNNVQNTASGNVHMTFITMLWTRRFGKVDPLLLHAIIIIVSSYRGYWLSDESLFFFQIFRGGCMAARP